MLTNRLRWQIVMWMLGASILNPLMAGQRQMEGSFTDPRDGKIYQTVLIGGKWWMAENLNYATDDGSWHLDGDEGGQQYGRFYNWNAAKTAPPPGWHLPSKQEFQEMLDSLGESREEQYRKLISGGGSGFSALLAGSYGGVYGKLGGSAHFWSCSKWWFTALWPKKNPWRLCLRKDDYVNIGHFATEDVGFNVRCVKDEDAVAE